MKVQVQGGSKVNLTQRDFVAEGGEGKIFVVGGTAYKIYLDPSKVIPEGKIVELAEIKDPRVVRPERLVYDEKGHAVGFTSRFVQSGGVVCQLFTKAFRDREGLTPDDVGDLVLKLRSMVENVHGARVLIVDLNEMNFLLNPKMEDIWAIDTASYQTPHYRATALMESVRDRHAPPNTFTELTDWFAFAVVSFRMFTGVHPYKGTHPTVKDMEDRMGKNLSVLNKDVKVPPTCYSFSVIPSPFLDWYRSVFEQGQRTPPPVNFAGAIIPVLVKPTVGLTGTATLDITKLGDFDGDILGVWAQGSNTVVVTGKSIYLDGRRVGDTHKGTRGCGFTRGGHAVVAALDGTDPVLYDATARSKVSAGWVADSLMSYDGRLYMKTLDKILAVSLTEMGAGSQVVATSDVVVNVLEHATKLFSGVVLQNLLGSTFVSIFPTAGASVQFRMPELDKVRVVDAKYDGGVLMALVGRKGTYDRYVFRVDDTGAYDVRVVQDVTPSGLNFVTLDSGVCVCLTEDAKLEVFSARKGSSALRVVEDKTLHGGMRLYKRSGKVLFADGSTLYTLSLR